MPAEIPSYGAFVVRIGQAKTFAELHRLETALDRLYRVGVFSVYEFAQLDGTIFRKLARIDAGPQ